MDPVPVIYSYLPVPAPARGGAPIGGGGGALISVSPRAATAIRAHLDPGSGLLEAAARRVLVELDDREGRSTELGLLVRALARRDVLIRAAPAARDGDE